eukprot:499264-Pelagomonas_calceolata.AAC.1
MAPCASLNSSTIYQLTGSKAFAPITRRGAKLLTSWNVPYLTYDWMTEWKRSIPHHTHPLLSCAPFLSASKEFCNGGLSITSKCARHQNKGKHGGVQANGTANPDRRGFICNLNKASLLHKHAV